MDGKRWKGRAQSEFDSAPGPRDRGRSLFAGVQFVVPR